MNIQTQEELLLFLLVPYINNELGTNILPSDLSIKYLENDQNSNLAFHIFSNGIYNSFNLRVYIQYNKNASFSEIYFEDSKRDTGDIVNFLLNSTEFSFSLVGSDPINLSLSVQFGNEFYNLDPGNILPLDYEFINITSNTNENYNILLLDDNSPLLINNLAVMVKEN